MNKLRKSKVTQKEFITIVNEVIGKEYAGYDGILNLISFYAQRTAHHYESENCPVLANEAQEISDKIYEFLLNKGVYDNDYVVEVK